MRAVIHSRKHYVQTSLATVTGGAKADVDLVEAIEQGVQGSPNTVTEGALVKAVYIEDWLRTGDTATGSFIAVLYKVPGTGVNFTTAQLAAVGDAENKKNIFFFSQGLVNDQDSNATPLAKNWFKIPKSKQRFGLGDRLVWTIFAQAAIDLHRCGFSTYKEYN